MNTHAHLVETLRKSPTFCEYQRAFSEATGLPLTLRPVETWQPALRGAAKENNFCAIIASQSKTCSGCLQMQEQLCQGATERSNKVTCAFGLTEVAVPVRLGDKVIGYLVSGQVFLRKPTEEDLNRTIERMGSLGVSVDREKVREAYLETRVVTASVLDSAATLLSIFAEHLSMISNQLVIRQANIEPAVVTRVKEFVRTRHEDDIDLTEAARAAHTSTFHLCKVFKKTTGMCFTEYLSRTRVEKAKELLVNPNLRVSEVAYQVGFQSLTHFNRIFRKLVGESPTEYRNALTFTLAA